MLCLTWYTPVESFTGLIAQSVLLYLHCPALHASLEEPLNP